MCRIKYQRDTIYYRKVTLHIEIGAPSVYLKKRRETHHRKTTIVFILGVRDYILYL